MKPALRAQLEALHSQLRQAGTVDPEARELLLVLLADITRLLQQPDASGAEHQSLTERLDALAVQFEAGHPALGTALRRLIDTLSNAGI